MKTVLLTVILLAQSHTLEAGYHPKATQKKQPEISSLTGEVTKQRSTGKVCEKTNDGCNTCVRYCGDDGWNCTSAYCPSNLAMCEKNAIDEGRDPKGCTKHKVKP